MLALCGPTAALATELDFEDALTRVDYALRNNPKQAPAIAVESCLARRNYAAELYAARQTTRAQRSLDYCFDVLAISKKPAKLNVEKKGPATPEELQARAALEVERALDLTPDVANGLKIYRDCALCHEPEGWGLPAGSTPQIAGQHRSVVIKQLADIRAGNRDNVMMAPYSAVEVIGGPQAVADVAAYIDTLEISTANDKGKGDDLGLGKKLYAENCARCHGEQGEGDAKSHTPRIQAQHYRYLVRQFEWIRDGKRRNANAEMVEQIKAFGERDTRAVLDYVSRLEPPASLQAPPGWHNPDFPSSRRTDWSHKP